MRSGGVVAMEVDNLKADVIDAEVRLLQATDLATFKALSDHYARFWEHTTKSSRRSITILKGAWMMKPLDSNVVVV